MGSNIFSAHSDPDLQRFIIAALGAEIFMLVFFMECKVYDLSTAMFFAFALGGLARGNFSAFHLLYLPACFNRETTILLSLVFGVYYFQKMEIVPYLFRLGYQGAAFVGARVIIMKIFEGNAGEPFYFWPARVIQDYWSQTVQSLILVVLIALAGYWIARRWDQKPALLRSAAIVIMPILILLHLTLGIAFELRVFAEVFPIAWVLGWWTVLQGNRNLFTRANSAIMR